jgi:hypothetical protein
MPFREFADMSIFELFFDSFFRAPGSFGVLGRIPNMARRPLFLGVASTMIIRVFVVRQTWRRRICFREYQRFSQKSAALTNGNRYSDADVVVEMQVGR